MTDGGEAPVKASNPSLRGAALAATKQSHTCWRIASVGQGPPRSDDTNLFQCFPACVFGGVAKFRFDADQLVVLRYTV